MLSRVQIYLLLAAAIVAEVVATTALARSAGLTKLFPSLVAVVGYAFAFWLLSLPFRSFQQESSTPSGRVWGLSLSRPWPGPGRGKASTLQCCSA